MNWYYVENGQRAGPVSGEQMAQLRADGRVLDQTLVWREGMADWKPWSEATGAPPVMGEVACAECGNSFKLQEVIRVNDRFVCASCKPVYLQRVREGAVGSGGAGRTGTVTQEEVRARDYEHDIGGYLNQSWALFKSDPGLIMGASVLVYLCLMVPQAAARLLGMIPLVGIVLVIPIWIVLLVITGPLLGGLWSFYLKKLRGGQATVGDAFRGFGTKFGQLFLTHVVSSMLSFVLYVPGGVLLLVPLITAEVQHRNSPVDSPVGIVMMVAGGLLLLAGFCANVYLAVSWVFALPLVADKGMKFWPAMGLSRTIVGKHWWMSLLILVVFGLVGSVGILACCVGLLVSGPVAFAAFAYAYEKLFGDLAPGQG